MNKHFPKEIIQMGLIPGLGRSPGEGKGYPLQYSDLENSMDCIVLGVAKSQTRLSDFHFYFPKEITQMTIKQMKMLNITNHRGNTN